MDLAIEFCSIVRGSQIEYCTRNVFDVFDKSMSVLALDAPYWLVFFFFVGCNELNEGCHEYLSGAFVGKKSLLKILVVEKSVKNILGHGVLRYAWHRRVYINHLYLSQ